MLINMNRVWQYLAAFTGNLAFVAVGTTFTWSSPIVTELTGPDWEKTSPLDHRATIDEISWIGSLLTIGAVFGPFCSGFLSNRIGRKSTLLVIIIPMIIGWIVMANTRTIGYIYSARILSGISVGGIFATLPVYLGEISEKTIRGSLGSFLQLSLAVGFTIAYSIGPYVSFQMFSYILLIIPITFFVSFFFMPESPYFLLGKPTVANKERAIRSLMKLRGETEKGVQQEMIEIEKEIESNEKDSGSITNLIWNYTNLKILYISLGLLFFQQASCSNIVVFYASSLVNNVADPSLSPNSFSIILGIIQILTSLVTPFIVDRMGRKILMEISGIGMMMGFLLLGSYFYLLSNSVENIEFLSLFSITLFIFGFNLGYGSLTWVIITEICPTVIRTTFVMVTSSFGWIVGFLITKYIPILASWYGIASISWVVSIVCLFSAIFIYIFVPETKAKSFLEIQNGLK